MDNKKISLAEHHKIFWKITAHALKQFPFLLSLIAVINVILALIPAASIWIGKLILDKIVIYITQSVNYAHLFKSIMILVFIEFLLVVLQTALNKFADFLTLYFSTRFELFFREKLLNRCNEIPYYKYEDTEFYNQLEMMIQGIYFGTSSYIGQQISFVRSIIRLISISFILIEVNVIFMLVVFGLNILDLLFNFYISNKRYDLDYRLADWTRKIQYLFQLLTKDTFLKDIKLFCLGKEFLNRYVKLNRKVIQEDTKFERKEMYLSSLSSFLMNCAYYGFYIYIIFGVLKRKLTVGDISLYQRAYQTLNATLNSLVSNFANIYHKNLYFKLFFDFLDTSYHEKQKDPLIPLSNIDEIHIDNIRFAYPKTSNDALKNISLKIKKGETIAIVGENGAGKTTLIKLLANLYTPTSGKILINQKPISDYETRDYLEQLGVMLQDFNKYHMTFKDNVVVGEIDEANNEERLENIIKEADMDAFVKKLPKGKNNFITKWFEDGQPPSSGEWQKIALARILFRNPNVIILDEPTTNIDNFYRHALFQKIKKLAEKKDKIIIIISHNLHSIKFADKIILIEKGEIKERGTHDELIALQGKYYDLWLRDNGA